MIAPPASADPPRMPIAVIRAEHLALLAAAQDSDLPPGPEGRCRVQAFVDAVAVSGQLLDLPDERRAAQGLMDYWVAGLNSVPRKEGEAAPRPVSAQLLPFDKAALDVVVDRVDHFAEGKPRGLVVALLMCLLEPDDRRRRFVPIARPYEDWLAACQIDLPSDREMIAPTAEQLVEAGLVLISEVPAPGSASDAPHQRVAQLAASGVMHAWQPLAEAVAERLRFREHALLWKEGSTADAIHAGVAEGASAAPSTAWTRALASAGLAPHPADAGRPLPLDPLERAYAEHRRALAAQRQRWAVRLLGALLLAAGATIVVLYLLWSEAHQQRAFAERQREIAEEKAEAAGTQAARADAEAAEAREARRLVTEQLMRAQRVTDEIRTLISEGRLDRPLFSGILEELAPPPPSVGAAEPQHGGPASEPSSGTPASVEGDGARLAAQVQQLNAPQANVRTSAAQRILTVVRDGGMALNEQDRVIGALTDALRDEQIRTWSANGRYNLIFVLSEIPTEVWKRPSLRETVAQLRQSINALKGRTERGETQVGPDTRRFLAILERRLDEAAASPATAIAPLSVYAHVASTGDRGLATDIVRSLGAQFPLVGVEYIATWGARPRAAGQVRFYRSDQRGAAQELAQRLRSATSAKTGRDVAFETQDISRTFPNLRDGRIEVWFPQLEPR